MKTTKLFLSIILLIILSYSCASDDNSDTQEPDQIETNKMVKTEKVSETKKVAYTYTDNGLLSSSIGTSPNFGSTANLTYNSNGKLMVWDHQETGSSTYSDTQNFSYDNTGLLTSYAANTENVSLVYNGNIVSLTGTIEGDSNSEAELVLNNQGLVVKFTESHQYTNFEYDSNGNMITTKSYDNSDNLIVEYTLSYDTKTNPFYGQFESIYIERFIEFFWKFDGIYISGFGGYSFPFLKK